MGLFYEQTIKAKIHKILEKENILIVEHKKEKISFDLVSGFESNKLQYTGY